MQRVKVNELKDQLSRYLRSVEAGGEVEVTDRDRPIARIVPIPKAGAVTLRPARRTFASVRSRRFRPAGWRRSSTELLLEDRREP